MKVLYFTLWDSHSVFYELLVMFLTFGYCRCISKTSIASQEGATQASSPQGPPPGQPGMHSPHWMFKDQCFQNLKCSTHATGKTRRDI